MLAFFADIHKHILIAYEIPLINSAAMCSSLLHVTVLKQLTKI